MNKFNAPFLHALMQDFFVFAVRTALWKHAKTMIWSYFSKGSQHHIVREAHNCKISGVFAVRTTLWKQAKTSIWSYFSKGSQHHIVREAHMSPCKKGGYRFGRIFWSKLPQENEVTTHRFTLFSKGSQHHVVREAHMSPCKKGGSWFSRIFWSKLPQ